MHCYVKWYNHVNLIKTYAMSNDMSCSIGSKINLLGDILPRKLSAVLILRGDLPNPSFKILLNRCNTFFIDIENDIIPSICLRVRLFSILLPHKHLAIVLMLVLFRNEAFVCCSVYIFFICYVYGYWVSLLERCLLRTRLF